jgi:nucleoside-diphosphate-sugar epimerase
MNAVRVLLIGANGYVGSRVAEACAQKRWPVLACDREPARPDARHEEFFHGFYSELPDSFIKRCDVAFWFSGHSSVKIADADPAGSVRNNVVDLVELFERLAARGKPVIYASSASVLSSITDTYSPVANEASANAYDATKLAFDVLAPFLGARAVGLRMATVSGWSPNMRWDLIFNAMNRTAALEGVVRVQNASNFRSILFLEDLCSYLFDLAPKLAAETWQGARRVALGSWSGTIGGLAAGIADYWRVPVEYGADSKSYSFVLNDRELAAAFPQPNDFRKSLRVRCDLFREQSGWPAR